MEPDGEEMIFFYAVFRTGEASDIEVVNDNIQRMVEKYMPTEHNGWKLELSVIPLATKHQTSSETTKRLVIYGFWVSLSSLSLL